MDAEPARVARGSEGEGLRLREPLQTEVARTAPRVRRFLGEGSEHPKPAEKVCGLDVQAAALSQAIFIGKAVRYDQPLKGILTKRPEKRTPKWNPSKKGLFTE